MGCVPEGKHLTDLALPDVPGTLAPEVVHPEKPAFQKVGTQIDRLPVVDVQVADLEHHDERAMKELGIGELHHQMTGLPRPLVNADRRLRQLAQAGRQVQIGIRIIGEPSAAVAALDAPKRDTTEVERSVKRVPRRDRQSPERAPTLRVAG